MSLHSQCRPTGVIDLLEHRVLLSGGQGAQWQGFVDASSALQTASYTFARGAGGNENYYDGDFGDFDNDGLIDRAVVNRYGILWNTGGGIMIPASNQANQAPPQNSQKNLTGFRHNIEKGAGDDGIQWADIDNDGDLDVISGGNGEPFYIQENRKGRFFVKSVNIGHGGTISAWQIVNTDLERDGDVDLIVGSNFPNDFSVLVNNGTGTFTEQSASRGLPMDSDPPQGAVSGDVDGDGDYDLLLLKGKQLTSPELGIIVARNNGSGFFTRQVYPFGRTFPTLPDIRVNGDSNQAMNLADIDADGDLDLVIALGLFFTDHNLLNQTIGTHPVVSHAIFVNDGAGNFVEQSAQRWNTTGYNGPILRGDNGDLGDVDLDGDLDFVALRRDSAEDIKHLQVYLNNGSGVFTYRPEFSMTFPGGGVGFGNDLDLTDLDGDGALDVWVGMAGNKCESCLTRLKARPVSAPTCRAIWE